MSLSSVFVTDSALTDQRARQNALLAALSEILITNIATEQTIYSVADALQRIYGMDPEDVARGLGYNNFEALFLHNLSVRSLWKSVRPDGVVVPVEKEEHREQIEELRQFHRAAMEEQEENKMSTREKETKKYIKNCIASDWFPSDGELRNRYRFCHALSEILKNNKVALHTTMIVYLKKLYKIGLNAEFFQQFRQLRQVRTPKVEFIDDLMSFEIIKRPTSNSIRFFFKDYITCLSDVEVFYKDVRTARLEHERRRQAMDSRRPHLPILDFGDD